MRTNIDIDDALIDEVMKVANVKTKKDAVHLALREFLKARKKKNLFDLAGKIEFEDGFDHKSLRHTRHDAD
jgi:Arc/MetJ family transcription regulator